MSENKWKEGRDQKTTEKPVFAPSSEWIQDPSNHILLIQLPGFKKDDIKVIAYDTGRLIVRGTKLESANFEQSYSAPIDSNIDKISGKFENGCLALIVPKAATVEPQKPLIASQVGKIEETLTMKAKKIINDEKEHELLKEKPRIQEDQVEAPIEKTVEEAEELMEELIKAISIKNVALNNYEKGNVTRLQDKQGSNKGLTWDAKDGWIDWRNYKSIDTILEKINQNRKAIAIAFMAFSIGFYASHRLRTRR